MNKKEINPYLIKGNIKGSTILILGSFPLYACTAPAFIKWIFPYRSLPDREKKGFQLGAQFKTEEIPSLQPLIGLTELAAREALTEFDVAEEFVWAVLQKGAV